jgi:hypothetical protein
MEKNVQRREGSYEEMGEEFNSGKKSERNRKDVFLKG